MHKKLATDDNLDKRSCIVLLFLSAVFVSQLCQWLGTGTHQPIDLSSWESIISSTHAHWGGAVKEIIISAKLHIFWFIWIVRNAIRFQSKASTMQGLFGMLIVEAKLSRSVILKYGAYSYADFVVTLASLVKFRLLHGTCSCIFRESNSVADVLAKNGQGIQCFASQW